MIPTYSSEKTNNMKIVVNHLAQLNTYDFTEPHRHDYFEFFYFKKVEGRIILILLNLKYMIILYILLLRDRYIK